MFIDLDTIISELSTHNPDTDWASLPSRIDSAIPVSADPDITKHLRYVRGALIDYVAVQGIENNPGFLLKLIQTEMLKIGWLSL